MKSYTISQLLSGNTYPGRGIVVGKSADGKKSCAAYFIMGRSANSRNRVLRMENGVLSTEPYDAAKVENPSLIIYRAIRPLGNRLIVTNGTTPIPSMTVFAQAKVFPRRCKAAPLSRMRPIAPPVSAP